MALETILEPINGQEAKEILKSMMNERIDKIPLLKVGNAFKQIKVGFELIFEAFPADVPVPMAEWEILLGIKEGEDIKFDEFLNNLDKLKDKRAKIAEKLSKIDTFLEKHNPMVVDTIIESDNGTPDELRVKHDLKLPMLHTSPSGKKSEVMVNAKDIK